jgi:hypothetical protein
MDRTQVKLDLECITQQRPIVAGETMADVLKRLDAVAREPELPHRMQHYLSQRSYLKALEWLDHPEAPHVV